MNDAPTLIDRAASLGKALVGHVADGCRKASPEVQAERERICFSNVCGRHDAAADACGECGCGVNPALSFVGLDLKLKRSWASSRCPKTPPLWGIDLG